MLMDGLLSGDRFRSPVLAGVIALITVALVVLPFADDGPRALAMGARICIFVVLVASYDVLLGYTGIVSFAHTMFFGFGAYGAAIALDNMGASWGAIGLGTLAALGVSIVVAVAIGLLSLRVRAIFFAMITLAAASFVLILASQLHEFTGGEDGITYSVPRMLKPAFKLFDGEILGLRFSGKIVSYYLVFLVSAVLFLVMLRVVNSPFGRVLLAIRENEFRAEALGYRVVAYRTASFVFAACMATLAGVLSAVWLRYTGPDTSMSFAIMIDVLLMLVIGGMASMYGAIIGVVIMNLAQFYLQDLMEVGMEATISLPLIPELIAPERWLLWLGVLFILCVYHFPAGIVGRLRGLK
ncbi:branched-chain amino acid ABC transporter permease [Marinibaculum pumilum]|uniref:Branched-chain amino acid ABC transporter permease n=1 Tax=Marinibaculum pumilum TaxID=1766165 RepID=A0ABV7KWN7_9PROT